MGPPRRRKSGNLAREAYRMPQGRQGAQNSGRRVEDPPSYNTTLKITRPRGGSPLHVGMCGPAELHP